MNALIESPVATLTRMPDPAVEQAGALSPSEQAFAERRVSMIPAKRPALDIEGAARIAIKHMPLNDLMFLIAQEIERQSRHPSECAPDGKDASGDWAHDCERTAEEIKEVARRVELLGLQG